MGELEEELKFDISPPAEEPRVSKTEKNIGGRLMLWDRAPYYTLSPLDAASREEETSPPPLAPPPLRSPADRGGGEGGGSSANDDEELLQLVRSVARQSKQQQTLKPNIKASRDPTRARSHTPVRSEYESRSPGYAAPR